MSREQKILIMFNKAKEVNDILTMMECITEMKKECPELVDLMMNVMFEVDNDDDDYFEDDDDEWFDEE